VVGKGAFTLIELIFAIVVIGIAVVSLPMMNQVISTGIEKNIVQEAIFAAATELNEATTAHWDENSLEPNEPNSLARVIETGSCENNASLVSFRQMPGHISQPLHRRCLDSNATTVDNSSADANIMALDDMTKTDVSIFTNNTTNQQAGYKKDYKATVSVTNANVIFGIDQVNANPNMKKITVSVKDGATVVTSLSTYSANIGEVDYYKKEY